jgi:hypothetical protein
MILCAVKQSRAHFARLVWLPMTILYMLFVVRNYPEALLASRRTWSLFPKKEAAPVDPRASVEPIIYKPEIAGRR